MKSIKDIIYNISDILVAMLIILIVFLIIDVNINSIMAYPLTLQNNTINKEIKIHAPKTNLNATTNENNTKNNNNVIITETETQTNTATPEAEQKVELCSVYIEYGEGMNSIADKFVSVGLFESRQDFKDIINQLDLSEKIQAGNFVIPLDATEKEVIAKITKSNI